MYSRSGKHCSARPAVSRSRWAVRRACRLCIRFCMSSAAASGGPHGCVALSKRVGRQTAPGTAWPAAGRPRRAAACCAGGPPALAAGTRWQSCTRGEGGGAASDCATKGCKAKPTRTSCQCSWKPVSDGVKAGQIAGRAMQQTSAMPPARAPGCRLERGGCGNARCTASGSCLLLSCQTQLRGPGGHAAILPGRALCLE